MAEMFAFDANAPIAKVHKVVPQQEIYTLERFKQALQDAGVSRLTIVWGNHEEQFYEVPQHLMQRYLRHRKKMLHKQALVYAQNEYEALVTQFF